jgi:hypothetical protein
MVPCLIRLLGLFREYRIPFYEINPSLIEQLSGQRSALDTELMAHALHLITSVRDRFMRMYSNGNLPPSDYQTIRELFETLLHA